MMTRPTRDDLAIGLIRDAIGESYLVVELRPTAHGFDLALGWPEDMSGPGNPRVILTMPLIEYLTATRPRDVALPISRSTIKKLRNDLSLRWSWDDWWAARADDLGSMTLEAFCARHGCSMGAASQRRRSLPTAKPN